MAIYHLQVNTIGRSNGRNAVRAAAYRAAERLTDERSGETFSYTRKAGVEHKEILAPDGAPAWVSDRVKLWSAVEQKEARCDAQLAREIVVTLPRELSPDDQVELIQGYVREQFVARGMVADLCIHRDNPDHPHAHVMLTMRELGPDGFGNKARQWNAKELLLEWRAEWANHANLSLERAGLNVRIDHRSYEAQGIDLEPQGKIGRAAGHEDGRDLVRERMAEHEEIARRNGDRIIEDPNRAIHALTLQHATFTRTEVGRWLNSRTSGAEQFQQALDRVMASDELVPLGPDAKGNERFTTREMLEIERNMVDDAQRMKGRQSHQVADRYLAQAENARPNLSAEQRAMVRHVVKDSGDLAVVQGVAGAGKSYALATAREAWEAQGFQVRGAALAGKAAEGLEVSAGIASRSIHAWERSWQNGYDRLTNKDVLVIDEAGMVGSRQMQRVLAEAERAGAKVVLVGDVRQLQAIEAGAPMRAIAERVGQVELGEVRRQEDDWQKKASEDLAKGNVAPALDAYEKAGHVHEHGSTSAAVATMVERWNADRQTHPKESHLMLAFRRDEVRALNDAARAMRQANGELGADHRIATENGERNFATGERVVFLQNNRQLGVKNGTLGTIEKLRGNLMTVRLDGPEERRLAFDVRDYKHLDHGYTVTVHKAQGITADRVHVLASDLFDQHVAYVALSRHRKQVELHWSRETFRDRDHLVRQLGRERMKDLALDHAGAEQVNWTLRAERERQPEQRPADIPIRPEVVAKFEAMVAAREKELDARVAFEERVAKREQEMDRLADQILAKEKAGLGKQPMTLEELTKLGKQVVDLERAAKTDPGRAKELQAAQKAYAAGDAELKERRKVRAQEIKQDRGPGLGRELGLGYDHGRGRGR